MGTCFTECEIERGSGYIQSMVQNSLVHHIKWIICYYGTISNSINQQNLLVCYILFFKYCSDIYNSYEQVDKQKFYWYALFHFISFIFIPWIHTALQNPFGYGNSQICSSYLEVKSIQKCTIILVTRSITIFEIINIT
jgi:hypothetical protein